MGVNCVPVNWLQNVPGALIACSTGGIRRTRKPSSGSTIPRRRVMPLGVAASYATGRPEMERLSCFDVSCYDENTAIGDRGYAARSGGIWRVPHEAVLEHLVDNGRCTEIVYTCILYSVEPAAVDCRCASHQPLAGLLCSATIRETCDGLHVATERKLAG